MNCCNGWTTECFSCVREAAIIYCNYYDHSGPGDESNDKIGPRDENSDKCDIKQGKRVSGQIEWVLKWLTPAKQCQAALSYEPSREIPAWKSDLDCPAFFFSILFYFYCLFTVAQLLCGKSDLTEQHVHSLGSRQKARQNRAPEGTQAAATTLAEQSSHLKLFRLEKLSDELIIPHGTTISSLHSGADQNHWGPACLWSHFSWSFFIHICSLGSPPLSFARRGNHISAPADSRPEMFWLEVI